MRFQSDHCRSSHFASCNSAISVATVDLVVLAYFYIPSATISCCRNTEHRCILCVNKLQFFVLYSSTSYRY